MIALIPDEAAARTYLERRRWPHGPRCPVCESDRIGPHSPGIYRCVACGEAFTVRTGTVLERSHVPLHLWLRAIAMRAEDDAWPTSTALSAAIGLRQPTAWSMLRRLKEAVP